MTKLTTITTALLLGVTTTVLAADYSKSGIMYDHALHAEMGMECVECHEGAWESNAGTDLLLPEKASCANCHDVESMDNCGLCHVDVDDPWGYAEKASAVDRFSHVAHVESEMDCASCHGPAEAIVAAPPKVDCRSCHTTAADLQDCHVCHSQGEEYVPDDHIVGWELWHGVEAGHDQQNCSNCHAQVDCQDCHSGDNVERPRSHRLNFAFDHSWEARGNQIECATCHMDPGFCADCHRQYDVLPRNHSRADWLLPTGDGGAHGTEALLEMEGCISCHDTGASDPLCADCHGR